MSQLSNYNNLIIIKKKTKQTYNIEFDETGSTALASKQASSNTRTKTTSNVSIKIPDLISNATTSYANKSNNYQRLNEQDNSDNESRSKSYSTSNNHSLQMQHEVTNILLCLIRR